MRYSKAKYIEKFGEEAYNQLLSRNREYYALNKEKRSTQIRLYQEEHKDEKLKRDREYHHKHKEVRNKQRRDNYAKDIESNRKKARIFYSQHISEKKAKYKEYYNTKAGKAMKIIKNYRWSDKEKNRGECTLSQRWILENIFASSCVYCGDSDWKHLGADRIDNSKPHTPDNCVCSCGICNVERQCKSMSVAEFVEYRKNHPRSIDLKPEVVDVDGIKVLRKKVRD